MVHLGREELHFQDGIQVGARCQLGAQMGLQVEGPSNFNWASPWTAWVPTQYGGRVPREQGAWDGIL